MRIFRLLDEGIPDTLAPSNTYQISPVRCYVTYLSGQCDISAGSVELKLNLITIAQVSASNEGSLLGAVHSMMAMMGFLVDIFGILDIFSQLVSESERNKTRRW